MKMKKNFSSSLPEDSGRITIGEYLEKCRFFYIKIGFKRSKNESKRGNNAL